MGELHPKTTKLQVVRFPHHAIGMKFADRRLATEIPLAGVRAEDIDLESQGSRNAPD